MQISEKTSARLVVAVIFFITATYSFAQNSTLEYTVKQTKTASSKR